MVAVAVSNDLGYNGGSRRRTTAGDDMGDDVGDDVGDGDNGGNNGSNNAGKGDGWGGLLAEDAAAAAAAAATAAVVAAYCRGRMLFIVKILFLCGIFMMCGGDWQGHTSPHTLVTLEVCRRTFGWGRKLSSKIVVCEYQKLASKKAWQPKLVVFYRLVWATKLLLAAIGLIFPALVLGYKSFNCSMYHVPVPMLIEKFV